jgi:hypothetical protein
MTLDSVAAASTATWRPQARAGRVQPVGPQAAFNPHAVRQRRDHDADVTRARGRADEIVDRIQEERGHLVGLDAVLGRPHLPQSACGASAALSGVPTPWPRTTHDSGAGGRPLTQEPLPVLALDAGRAVS